MPAVLHFLSPNAPLKWNIEKGGRSVGLRHAMEKVNVQDDDDDDDDLSAISLFRKLLLLFAACELSGRMLRCLLMS